MGVSFGQMFRETFFRPVFLLLALCMMMTASVELGPNTWLTPVLESAGMRGILVLVWISLLMAMMRQFAGPLVRRLAPPGILLCSAVVSGVGLIALSYAQNFLAALAAGTIFAAGVAYFWPTMVGFTSERVPKGGALALAVLGSAGTAAVGLLTIPMMGHIADQHLRERLPFQETTACLRQIVDTFPALASQASGKQGDDISQAAADAQTALEKVKGNVLPEPETANALRSAIAVAPKSAAEKSAKELIGPPEKAGHRIAFRWVAVMSALLAVIFGGLYVSDRFRARQAA
jgi:hypothetical protein